MPLAVRFDAYGDIDVLKVVGVTRPVAEWKRGATWHASRSSPRPTKSRQLSRNSSQVTRPGTREPTVQFKAIYGDSRRTRSRVISDWGLRGREFKSSQPDHRRCRQQPHLM